MKDMLDEQMSKMGPKSNLEKNMQYLKDKGESLVNKFFKAAQVGHTQTFNGEVVDKTSTNKKLINGKLRTQTTTYYKNGKRYDIPVTVTQ